jgi:hypothetical protein
MAKPPGRSNTLPELELTISTLAKHRGHVGNAAAELGLSGRAVRDRMVMVRRRGLPIPEFTAQHESGQTKGRLHAEILDGVALIASDAHYWPGEPTTAHRAFVHFCATEPELKLVVMNGDAIDCAAISRHPPIGWTHIPSVKDEIEVTRLRLDEIALAAAKSAPHVRKVYTAGNHDIRFETKIAASIPELKGVDGTSLADHFEPDWEKCWSLFVNDNLVIKHRFKGGMRAADNNVLWAGRSICTGHLHRIRVSPHCDYNGIRYGIECGCLADPYGPQFQDYTEDNPKAWQSGFIRIRFAGGRILLPEIIAVVEPGVVQFRGELIEV